MKHAVLLSLGILLASCCTSDAVAADENRRIETGRVNWLRNLDEARLQAAKTDKPILLLFQEIPG